ncbi:nascent polypeptide-associated complex subunit alpha, muscle-specific form [Drosophila biarmipes]|uniref:nascent polypeptide-associated complex subunit alpha, muscle-specific form n=1 Tax=Drosophila biarmipes TaxID=125945 RepID=UPI0007E80240|nr:nascent polypeptide-associated complex subunit alpha, muscle-specific form [Drosophila biarmipes]
MEPNTISAEKENPRESLNPEDGSISTGQPAATSTPTNMVRKSSRIIDLHRESEESDLRNSSMVGRIPPTLGHVRGRKTIRAPATPEKALSTRSSPRMPKTPISVGQPKTPRSASTSLSGRIAKTYGNIKGRKGIRAPSTPKMEPQSSPVTPKSVEPAKTPKITRAAKMSTKNSTTVDISIANDSPMGSTMGSPKTPKMSPIGSPRNSPTDSPIQSTNNLPPKSATESPATPTMGSSRKSSIESPKYSPIILPKTSPIQSPSNSPIKPIAALFTVNVPSMKSSMDLPTEAPIALDLILSTDSPLESPLILQAKEALEMPSSSPKQSSGKSSIESPMISPPEMMNHPEKSPGSDDPKEDSSEVASSSGASPEVRVGSKRGLASSELNSDGIANTSEPSPKRARLYVLQVNMGSPFSMTRIKKIRKVSVDIEISGNDVEEGLPEALAEPEEPGMVLQMDADMEPQMEPEMDPEIEPEAEPEMVPRMESGEIIDTPGSPEPTPNTSMKCILM